MLNTSERDALKLTSDSTEANGLVIYNIDINCVEFWSNGKWIDLSTNVLSAVNINPNTITTHGSGTLVGHTCFDIGEGNFGTVYRDSTGHTPNRSDFSQNSVRTQYYTFTASASGTVKNVRYVVEDPKGTQISATQGREFMCYNLGASDAVKSQSPAQQANYSTPEDEYGDLYQWGRQADGHQFRSKALE